MSFSEDPSSPAAPFSGDGSGQIFDMPDMIASSPTTNERIVDTQSGFLVVIKKLNDRLALSVKRHIGTPPGSQVALTPDESLKLSRILATSFSSNDDWNSLTSERKERRTGGDRRRSIASSAFNLDNMADAFKADADDCLSDQAHPPGVPLVAALRPFVLLLLGIAVSVFALGIGAGIAGSKLSSKDSQSISAIGQKTDPLDSKKVDAFVRDFVAKLLDFSGATYRMSQIQAMAVMSPELLERYWKETKFPLTKRQLSSLPHGTSVMIAELKQERVDANTVLVAVHAQLSNEANPKVVAPVDLRLKLSSDSNHQIIVIDQQDLSASAQKK